MLTEVPREELDIPENPQTIEITSEKAIAYSEVQVILSYFALREIKHSRNGKFYIVRIKRTTDMPLDNRAVELLQSLHQQGHKVLFY